MNNLYFLQINGFFNFDGDKLTSKLSKVAYFFWVGIAHKGMLFIACKSKDFSNGI